MILSFDMIIQRFCTNISGLVGCAFGWLLLLLSGCGQSDEAVQANVSHPGWLHRSMDQLTDVIVHDIFSPPVASRIYTYPSVAAYEILRQGEEGYGSLVGQLNGLEPIPAPGEGVDLSVASVHAFLTVGKNLVFSEEKIEDFQEKLEQEMKQLKVPAKTLQLSKKYGEQVAAHILAWADGDNYKQTRSFPKFTVTEETGRWKPTPPMYMDGIEPHWTRIRPFALDSAGQFAPPVPAPFELSPNSPFYKDLLEVYEVSKSLGQQERDIAAFWDCNPYVAHVEGHAMFATKKITPGGHWMGIAGIASRQAGDDMLQAAETYALVAVALADAFISCWDEKYRSAVIRPETVINKYLDENWAPLLQTPPFPEYTSGHSVISNAASLMLTSIYGQPFAFNDSTEITYGLPVRSFQSFVHAAEEAAISRLYGGIHYRPAIVEGARQGQKIGKYLAATLQTSARRRQHVLAMETQGGQ
jgi:hypothetical protein